MILVYVREAEDPKREAGVLMRLALAELGLPERPLRHDGLGRPFLEGGPQVSLSHTDRAAAAAVSTAGPVGVDLERLCPVRPRLAGRVMSPGEYAWYCARGECAEDFFTLWTLKESYYKYLGTGLPGYPRGTEFRLEKGLWRLGTLPLRFRTEQKGPLFLALCGEEQEVTVRW